MFNVELFVFVILLIPLMFILHLHTHAHTHRATLLLVPLLGLQYILTPFKPEPYHSWERAYETVSAFTASFQVSQKHTFVFLLTIHITSRFRASASFDYHLGFPCFWHSTNPPKQRINYLQYADVLLGNQSHTRQVNIIRGGLGRSYSLACFAQPSSLT